MLQYVGRRVLQFIPVFFGVTLILFFVITYLPSDPVRLRVGERSMSPELYETLKEEYGLNDPWYVQYWSYIEQLAQGDLGTSIYNGQPVSQILRNTYPYTMRLALVAIMIEAVVGIGAGIVSAVKRYSFWDVLVTMSTSILVALPVFWLGIMLQYFFGIWLKDWTNGRFYLPISGASGPFFPDWVHVILPAITLAAVSTAYAARIMRSQLLEVTNQDYVRTAFAKGLSSRAVLWNHAMKNALIPVVTFIGIDLGVMLSGAVLTETVYNWPGIGYTIFRAIRAQDYPVVVGGVIVILFAVMIINLLVDISYAFLDPRIRYGGSSEE
jgi:ABC-type dipeptide/oligopeptide/nickel transport system permease component